MNKASFLKRIITTSWFLAAIPAMIIMFFLPSMGSKYRLQVEPLGKNFASTFYTDLDSDSISEVIQSGKGTPYYNILVLDNNLRVYDQWNFKDNVSSDLSGFFFGNYDNDRYKEIYIFSFKGDSLFLNVNEFFQPDGLRLDRVYITKIGLVNNTVTSNLFPAGFFDLNGDGFRELYFSIMTGFALEPRLLYCFDIVNKELKSSQFKGVICLKPQLVDSDGDNKPEIFGIMHASGNYKTQTPFTDRSTWLMVFDEKLNFEFPPVEFPGLTNHLEINSYSNGKFRGYLLSHNTGSADTTVIKPRVMIFSLDGKMKKERLYQDFGFNAYTSLSVLNHKSIDRIYVMENQLLELNSELEVIKKVKSPFQSYYSSYMEDINSDGDKEFVLYSEVEEKLVIYNASLQKIAETRLRATSSVIKFSHKISTDHKNRLYLTSNEDAYFLEMIFNPFYYFGYLIYPGIYLLLVLFIVALNRINTFQVVQKENLNRRLVTLQLQGIKSQLDPHFTFNTLNSVASLIYLEDRETAYDYMIKFTELLRGMLNDAERIYRSLAEELQFLTTYLELEKLRFGDKFNFTIEIGEGVSQKEQVPKLVLQTFAENAIKHGIMPCAKGGLLTISVNKEIEYLKLTVEDNGIGRVAAAGHSISTGKGLKITSEFYDILNQINKRPIKHFIIDLYNEKGDPAGTRVEVWVPVED